MTKKDNTYPQFADLTMDEIRQLCFIAYIGDDHGGGMNLYVKHYRKTTTSYSDTCMRLQELGYLQTRSSVNPELHIDILDFLATELKDTLRTFKKIYPYSTSHKTEYLWKLSELLRKDDFEGAAKLAKPYENLGAKLFNVYPYIRNRAMTDQRYATLLDNDQIYQMTAESIEDMFTSGILDKQTIESFRKFVTPKHPKYDEIIERTDLYDFLVTGTYNDNYSPKTLWALAMQAIRELYCGHTEEAMELFRTAVKKQGAKAGSFPIPILNYFYALCIIKYRIKYGVLSKADVVNEFLSSTVIRQNDKHFAARLLLQYADTTTEEASNELLTHANNAMWIDDTHMNLCYTALLTDFFGVPKDGLYKLEGLQPAAAIMLHEMSAYMAISSSVKNEMSALFGGKPILANIHRKASWEVLLSEIDSTVGQNIDIRPRRIIYFIKGRELSSIVEQRQNADGTWEDYEPLSINVLKNAGYESMDMIDTQIAMGLANREQWQSDAYIVIPYLLGTDRLYYGYEFTSRRTQAIITQEAPYVEFSGQGAEISISSNAKIKNGVPCKHTIKIDGKNYTLITLNPLQKDILAKLLKHDTLPASAAPTLRKTIESLKGIIEVRENILSNVELNAYESDGHIALRIVPFKEEFGSAYRLTILASPLADGTARLVPGIGEEFVYDEDLSGNTHCVHRNMMAEMENYQAVVDYAQQFNLEFSSYNVFDIAYDHILLNFLAFCHRNPDKYIIEWPNGQVLKFKGILTETDIEIEVKSDIDWFTIEGNVRIGVDLLNLDQLISAYTTDSYDGFIRIGENEYVQMTEKLRKHIAQLDAVLKAGEKRKRSVPKYLVGVLAHTLEKMNHKEDDGFREFRDKMKQAYHKEVTIPEGLQATLRPYQVEGYQWLSRLDEWGAGACLSDDMGLGKTLQALAFILSKAECGASLVVAPKSVIPNWVAETQKFAPTLNVHVLNNESDREQTVNDAGAHTLILCTYGVLTSEADLLATKKWNVVCLDEAHQIKNRTTMASQSAMNLKSKSRIILTGTPLQNHVGELWNLMQFINPGMLGKWNTFRDTFVNADLDDEHRAMLKEMTQPFILRRTKQEVLADLPEKTETTHYVTLTNEEFEVYETMRRRVELKLKKNKNKEERTIARQIDLTYFEELMKLRLASCDMHLLHDRWKFKSSKITALMEILETLMDVPRNNIIVFSQFTTFLALIKPELESRGWEHLYLDGQTPMNKRKTIVEEFQQGKKRIFLSSLKAGGLGINLTQANYVILTDPWWNPAIENQATDRAHRIGQKRCVSVIRLISEHTIEEKILKLHDKKRTMSEDVLDGTAESNKLSYDDILEMVAPY